MGRLSTTECTYLPTSTRWPPRPLGVFPLPFLRRWAVGPLLPLLPVSASSSVILEEASPSKSFRSRDADSQRIQFEFAEFAANLFAAQMRC